MQGISPEDSRGRWRHRRMPDSTAWQQHLVTAALAAMQHTIAEATCEQLLEQPGRLTDSRQTHVAHVTANTDIHSSHHG